MNRQILGQICEQVYHRFPEVAGSSPDVQSRPGGQSLLIFRGAARSADGQAIKHTIRVVASAAGKILKITSSR
jgi:hypothetical protein